MLGVDFSRAATRSLREKLSQRLSNFRRTILSPTPTVDVKELTRKYTIEQLNQSAEEYWQNMRSSREVRAKHYTLTGIEHLLVQIAHLVGGLNLYPGLTVLDFGAGTCYASRILNQLGMRVISCDVSATALDIGKSLSVQYPPVGEQPEHTFLPFDGKKFDLSDGSVDRIFCLDALHHVPSQADTLREMARVLSDGGIAGFAEPGPRHSSSAESQFAMRNHTVIESDIVLADIFDTAKRFGFTEMKIAVAPIYPIMVPIADLRRFLDKPRSLAIATKARVSNFPIFFLYKGVPKSTDSRVRDDLEGVLKLAKSEILGDCRTPVRFEVEARNTSPKVWRASGTKLGCVNLGAFLHESASKAGILKPKQYRFSLSLRDVQPGEVIRKEVNLGLLRPGNYILDIDLVSEHVCWFGSICNSKLSVAIRVRS